VYKSVLSSFPICIFIYGRQCVVVACAFALWAWSRFLAIISDHVHKLNTDVKVTYLFITCSIEHAELSAGDQPPGQGKINCVFVSFLLRIRCFAKFCKTSTKILELLCRWHCLLAK
jgi:hypothetical protein